jgi:hypothetical protein
MSIDESPQGAARPTGCGTITRYPEPVLKLH